MAQPLKILLVQLYANGDCLYATTVAKQIKNDFPASHLTWAVSPSSKSMILNNPDVDSILEITTVRKDNVVDFRKLKKQISLGDFGHFDKVVITQIQDNNLANYDGSIRSAIFRGYPDPITIGVQPILNLYPEEINTVADFAIKHDLSSNQNVILFECAPQSGQSPLNMQMALNIARQLVSAGNTAVILSSANKIIGESANIIDGSVLSIRETAGLTHHCSLLLGSSSGLTWASTSTAAKQLPMIQLLNPDTPFSNPISRDFSRFNLDNSKLIELTTFNIPTIVNCVLLAINNFDAARTKFNTQILINFKTTSKIVYNLLCYGQVLNIVKHVAINTKLHGKISGIYLQAAKGIITFPFKLIYNFIRKQ